MSVDITVVWLLLAENDVCLCLQIKDALTDLKTQNQFRIKVWEKDPSSNNNVITARQHILPLRWFVLQKKLLRHIEFYPLTSIFPCQLWFSLIRFLFFWLMCWQLLTLCCFYHLVPCVLYFLKMASDSVFKYIWFLWVAIMSRLTVEFFFFSYLPVFMFWVCFGVEHSIKKMGERSMSFMEKQM